MLKPPTPSTTLNSSSNNNNRRAQNLGILNQNGIAVNRFADFLPKKSVEMKTNRNGSSIFKVPSKGILKKSTNFEENKEPNTT